MKNKTFATNVLPSEFFSICIVQQYIHDSQMYEQVSAYSSNLNIADHIHYTIHEKNLLRRRMFCHGINVEGQLYTQKILR